MLDSLTSCSMTGEALLSKGTGMHFQKVHISQLITKISTLDLEGRLKYSEKPDSIDHKMLDSLTSCSITGEALLSRVAVMCFQKVHISQLITMSWKSEPKVA